MATTKSRTSTTATDEGAGSGVKSLENISNTLETVQRDINELPDRLSSKLEGVIEHLMGGSVADAMGKAVYSSYRKVSDEDAARNAAEARRAEMMAQHESVVNGDNSGPAKGTHEYAKELFSVNRADPMSALNANMAKMTGVFGKFADSLPVEKPKLGKGDDRTRGEKILDGLGIGGLYRYIADRDTRKIEKLDRKDNDRAAVEKKLATRDKNKALVARERGDMVKFNELMSSSNEHSKLSKQFSDKILDRHNPGYIEERDKKEKSLDQFLSGGITLEEYFKKAVGDAVPQKQAATREVASPIAKGDKVKTADAEFVGMASKSNPGKESKSTALREVHSDDFGIGMKSLGKGIESTNSGIERLLAANSKHNALTDMREAEKRITDAQEINRLTQRDAKLGKVADKILEIDFDALNEVLANGGNNGGVMDNMPRISSRRGSSKVKKSSGKRSGGSSKVTTSKPKKTPSTKTKPAKPVSPGKVGAEAAKKSVNVGGKTVAKKTATKVAAKEGGKVAAKVATKSAIKKIPVIGALAGLGFAASRLAGGDFLGAGGEALSGLLGTIPGVGTAASIGVDAALGARDIRKATKPDEPAKPEVPKSDNSAVTSPRPAENSVRMAAGSLETLNTPNARTPGYSIDISTPPVNVTGMTPNDMIGVFTSEQYMQSQIRIMDYAMNGMTKKMLG